MADPLIPITTVAYKTYVKEALVEALTSVFAVHPDTTTLRGLGVSAEMPIDRAEYPAIVIRFFERSLRNIGIAHEEWIEKENAVGVYYRHRHLMYSGDIEFAIYALSSYDRDILSDALAQVLTMGDIEAYTQSFLNRIYSPNVNVEPTSIDHFVNLNTDQITPFGETTQIAPWMPEDVLVYQTSYRIGIMGELYSKVPTVDPAIGVIEHVNQYPYDPQAGDPVPVPEPGNPNPWVEG